MNWTTKEFTDLEGRPCTYEELELPGLLLRVRPLADGTIVLDTHRPHEIHYPAVRHFDTIEEGQAAAVPWLQQLILERLTAQARALGDRVVDAAVDDALLAYDDGLCPECNDGRTRIDWSKPADPDWNMQINPAQVLYSCDRLLHLFHPNDLEGMTDEHHFDRGRVLLVHFPEKEEAE